MHLKKKNETKNEQETIDMISYHHITSHQKREREKEKTSIHVNSPENEKTKKICFI